MADRDAGHIGETLMAPTILAYGTQGQKERFLPALKTAPNCGVRVILNQMRGLTFPTSRRKHVLLMVTG